MYKILSLIMLIGFFMTTISYAQLKYPATKKADVVDDYFGTKVADPYRWLEDDNSEETKSWVNQQNDVTNSYLSKIPFRDKIKTRFAELYNYPKYSSPFKGGDNYYFFKNDGLQNQSVLYIQKNLESQPEIFLDPNKLSNDGTVSLTTLAVSKDGKYFAYGTAAGGSDWNDFFVMEVAAKKKLDDHLKWIKFSGISWKDEGFYYHRFPTPEKGAELSKANQFGQVYYHKLGTDQSEDILVYEDKNNPTRYFGVSTTEDERFLCISFAEGTNNNGLLVKDLSLPNSQFVTIVGNLDNNYNVVDNIDDKLLIQTDYKAPNYRLILVDPKNPDEKNWVELLPEEKNVLQGVSFIGGKMVVNYLKDASSHVYLYETNGKLIEEIKLPTVGTVGGYNGKKDDNIAFYTFTSFTYPSAIFQFDVNTRKSTLFRRPELNFDFDNYETKQIFYNSKDGTKVPMFLVHKKGIKLDGNNSVYLYGYGGFNASMTPGFSVSRLLLLENDVVFALANIRGGGEYGESWHEAGTKLKKQNVFDDFIAAAEYLVNEGYSSSKKIAIAGGSNGGLLVGAVANQRPDLFKVALPAVGVMDMLRFHKFTIGYAWVSDYGSSENEEEFKYIYKYSPIHNLKSGVEYPATLVTTADHDDRVVPAHSFKYIATLQEKHKGNNPVLIRIETKAGHGAGKPTSKIIEEVADIYSFVFQNLGIIPKY
ncbi:MAG: prolyl oligopeptidase family serine peptidase [Ignavibacteria bacterium]|nr:prolyl oligopeptidase family serine peptidase [Ignavibacteria bacterium]